MTETVMFEVRVAGSVPEPVKVITADPSAAIVPSSTQTVYEPLVAEGEASVVRAAFEDVLQLVNETVVEELEVMLIDSVFERIVAKPLASFNATDTVAPKPVGAPSTACPTDVTVKDAGAPTVVTVIKVDGSPAAYVALLPDTKIWYEPATSGLNVTANAADVTAVVPTTRSVVTCESNFPDGFVY